jgi:hypothetical protein
MMTSIPATKRTKLSSLRQALEDVRRIALSSLAGGSQLPGDVDCVKPENAELENNLSFTWRK